MICLHLARVCPACHFPHCIASNIWFFETYPTESKEYDQICSWVSTKVLVSSYEETKFPEGFLGPLWMASPASHVALKYDLHPQPMHAHPTTQFLDKKTAYSTFHACVPDNKLGNTFSPRKNVEGGKAALLAGKKTIAPTCDINCKICIGKLLQFCTKNISFALGF